MRSLTRTAYFLSVLLAMVLLTISSGYAQSPQAPPAAPPAGTPSSDEARQAELRAAWKAAEATAISGPALVPLRDQAKLKLPDGMVFIPQAEASRLTRAMGNSASPRLVGIVTNFSSDDSWIVLVDWTADGFVRDDDAKDLNPDDILKELTEGTEEANKDRLARGFPEIALRGWTQPPQYDASTHRLAWSLRVVPKNDPSSGSVNFNTRALGRSGYFSLNLIDEPKRIEKDRPISALLLANLEYDPGKSYADFNASTDHVAEYGLAALIGVVALKKLGFIALAGVFLLKFAKIGLLTLAGVGLAIKRLFRRRPSA